MLFQSSLVVFDVLDQGVVIGCKLSVLLCEFDVCHGQLTQSKAGIGFDLRIAVGGGLKVGPSAGAVEQADSANRKLTVRSALSDRDILHNLLGDVLDFGSDSFALFFELDFGFGAIFDSLASLDVLSDNSVKLISLVELTLRVEACSKAV